MQALRQIKSAAAYTAEFKTHALKTEWNDNAQMALFYKGLKKEVKDNIAKQKRPNSLKGITILTIRINERLYERRLKKKREYSYYTPYKQKRKPYYKL